jgi:hypothetical protein
LFDDTIAHHLGEPVRRRATLTAGRSAMANVVQQDPAVLKAFAWSESIIADVLRRAYPRSQSRSVNDRLALRHLYFWKSLIFGSEAVSHKDRHALALAAIDAGLDPAVLADIDQAVLSELLDVVLLRFRGQREARQYHLMLLAIAGRLRVLALEDQAEPARHYEIAARGRGASADSTSRQ